MSQTSKIVDIFRRFFFTNVGFLGVGFSRVVFRDVVVQTNRPEASFEAVEAPSAFGLIPAEVGHRRSRRESCPEMAATWLSRKRARVAFLGSGSTPELV